MLSANIFLPFSPWIRFPHRHRWQTVPRSWRRQLATIEWFFKQIRQHTRWWSLGAISVCGDKAITSEFLLKILPVKTGILVTIRCILRLILRTPPLHFRSLLRVAQRHASWGGRWAAPRYGSGLRPPADLPLIEHMLLPDNSRDIDVAGLVICVQGNDILSEIVIET